MTTRKKVFCDTNVLLDFFDSDRPGHEDALALLWYAADYPEKAELVAAISSFKDVYYILSRLYHSEASARLRVEELMGGIVEPVDMLARYGAEALASGEPDFEDALVGICAENENAYVLLTGDTKAFGACSVPAMNVAAFLEQEGFDYEVVDW